MTLRQRLLIVAGSLAMLNVGLSNQLALAAKLQTITGRFMSYAREKV